MKKALLLIFALLLIPLVSAVEIADFYWTDTEEDTLTVNFGQSAQFEAYVIDGFSDFNVDISLENDETGDLVQIFNRDYNRVVAEAEIIDSITQDDYSTSGSFTLIINAVNDEGDRESSELNLVVNEEEENHAPTIQLTSPQNNAQNVPLETMLRWQGNDADGDQLSYDVYFNGRLIEQDTRSTSYILDGLHYETVYTWFVMVSDGELEARSPVWSFNTILNPDINHAPTVQLISPENGAQNVNNEAVELRWQGSDPDNDQLRYNVYFNGMLIQQNTRNTLYIREGLNYETRYTWQITVNDGELTTNSNIWSFTTIPRPLENNAPIINIISPGEYNFVSGTNYRVRWEASDADGGITSTKIFIKEIGNVDFFEWFFELFNDYELISETEGNPGNYLWDTTQIDNGIYSLKIIVIDDDNAEGEDIVERFTINNIAGNNAPVITSEPVTSAMLGNEYNYDVDAFDADNDEITYSIINHPEGMAINPITGLIEWLPSEIGVYQITAIASDGEESDMQTFSITVSEKEAKKTREIHEFSVSNVIIHEDGEYINVYAEIRNRGNQDEKISLRAINMQTGDAIIDSFKLENQDNYWRILRLPRPYISGVYTINVFGNSEDYNDMLYRTIVI